MKFKYGDTLRIRSDLYTILGKIRYIDTHGAIGYKYKLVKHKNNAEFWISWNKKRGVYQFTKLCGKELPSDMNVVLIFMPRFDIQILNDIHGFLTWPYIVGGNIILGIIVALVLFKR